MSLVYSEEKMDEIKKVLGRDRDFAHSYKSIRIRDTQGTTSGKSADVSRREVISSYCNKHGIEYPRMRQRIELQMYFDNLYGLDPYGLEPAKLNDQYQSISGTYVSTLPPENVMTDSQAKIIETKTFIYGVDASNMSDEQIFDKIREIEVKIGEYDKIVNKPKKLLIKIETMTNAISDLVKFVDERQEA